MDGYLLLPTLLILSFSAPKGERAKVVSHQPFSIGSSLAEHRCNAWAHPVHDRLSTSHGRGVSAGVDPPTDLCVEQAGLGREAIVLCCCCCLEVVVGEELLAICDE
jgi:hypothetical protein